MSEEEVFIAEETTPLTAVKALIDRKDSTEVNMLDSYDELMQQVDINGINDKYLANIEQEKGNIEEEIKESPVSPVDKEKTSPVSMEEELVAMEEVQEKTSPFAMDEKPV
ncbi:hypothetical protein MKX03_027660, partial [Papaver bracteatum]